MTHDDKPQYFKQSLEDVIPTNVPDPAQTFELSEQVRKKIDAWLLRYPPDQKRSGVFEALRLAQEQNGGMLSVPAMDAVALYLDLPKIHVYEIAAFYTLYQLNPVGKHVVDVCMNISCMLNGAHEVLEHFKKRLGIDLNETTADGLFTLREVECLGACVAPPVCMIGKKFYENLTANKIDALLAELRGSAKNGK